MSLIPHTFFPRKMLDTNMWLRPFEFGPTTGALDMFDPFDQFDMQMNNAMSWLKRPDFLPSPFQQPMVPQKYRITVNCAGFDPKNIKTDIQGDKLIVWGQEGDPSMKMDEEGDHKYHSFKKTFKLPEFIAKDKLTSFVTPRGILVVDMPYKMDEQGQHLWPQLVKDKETGKETGVQLNMQLPECVDPTNVHVTVKDRDVIVRASQKNESTDGFTKMFYYRRNTMPETTNMQDVKCIYDNNHKLTVTAPLITDYHQHAHTLMDHSVHPIPIECCKQK